MNPTGQVDSLLTYDEAAERLRVSPITLRRWVSDGKIGYRKIGRRSVRFTESDLTAMVHVHAPATSAT